LQPRQFRFERNDRVCALLRRGLAGERQQSDDVLAVGGADLAKMRIVGEIVTAIRQPEPALFEMRK
jgi:hypothetical protein